MNKHYKQIKIPARLGFLSYLGDVQGCGTIRVIQPYLLLNHYRNTKGVALITQTLSHYVFEPEFYKNYTFCQFQRSATEHHFKLFLHFKSQVQKKYNVPIIYEIDDMLIGIPDYNYATRYYSKNEQWVKKCMALSDGMIVSTEQLKKEYGEYCKNIAVIPNHLPKFIWGDIFPAHEYYEDKKIKILWSGSQNHFSHNQLTPDAKGGDFGNELMEFIKKTTDKYDWYFVGAMPNELQSVKDKICFIPWKNIFEYPDAVKSIEPDIAIAPLVDNPFNACKCLVGDTKVVTPKGTSKIKDIKKGDEIWQENEWKIVYSSVKYINKKTIKIRTYNGLEIEGTPNHRLRSNKEFKSLYDFAIGDKLDLGFTKLIGEYQYLSAPLFLTKKLDNLDFNDLNEDLLPKVKINERWGRFIGYILGDGHLRNGSGATGISCNIDYPDIIDDIVKFGKEIGLNQLTFVVKKIKKKAEHGYRKGKGLDVLLNSRNLRWFLGEKIGFSGRNGKNLNVPNVIFKSPKSVIKEFIRGLFEADGTIEKSGCSFVTKHKNLAEEIQFLLLGFNILSRIGKRKIVGRYYYTLYLGRQASDVFQKKINFISEKKKQKLQNVTNKLYSNAYEEWKLKDEIVEILYSENDVYDIQVPDGGYYLANGMISHNSNIKMLEFTAMGAAGVYSDVIPYNKAMVRTKTDEEMIAEIERLAADVDIRKKVFKRDYASVRAQLWWEEANNVKNYINTYLGLFKQRLP